ncbi:MAG: SDR family NAD(P)-dependent oxidoreductase [Nitratireductor sp.]
MISLIVTGAAGGIGRETVSALSAVGVEIICVDIASDRLDALCAEFSDLPECGDLWCRGWKTQINAARSWRRRAAVGGLVHLAGD